MPNRSWVYDGGWAQYLSNVLNQYTSVDSTGYEYDDNGNLTDDGTYYYYYDSQNRLTDVNDVSGLVAHYEYDCLGRRILKTVYGGAVTTTKYCYDGDQVIGEYENGTLLRKFIYGAGIDEPICMIDVSTDTYYFYHYDGLGSVVALSNTSGAIVEWYDYDVFGKPTIYTGKGADGLWRTGDDTTSSTSAVDNPYFFTGRRLDDETGLYYYRARMYSPEIGRFLQPDPIGYDDGLNMYTYVGNNPLSWTDPFGLCKGDRGFWRKLWEGDYFGTQYGASSTDIWAARAVASDTWYGKAGNYLAGGFSALWTPETYKETALTLASGYAASRSIASQGVKQTSNLSDDIAHTFRGSSYRNKVLSSDVTGYRYYGGKSLARGRWLTTRQTVSRINTKGLSAAKELALPKGATAEKLTTWTIPKGTKIYIGRIAGGGSKATQIFIENSGFLIP